MGVRACTNLTANAAWEIVAWAELEQEHPEKAYGTLRRIRPAADVDTYCLAAVEAARGQIRHAIGLLERARSSRKLCLDAIKLLIDRFYVAVPAKGNEPAQVWTFEAED